VTASPAVSVVIPTYNARACARRAIDSALGQTFGDIELLVIDDASTDGTATFIEQAYRDEARLRVLRLERNGGPARARNVGIKTAHGEWIALLDADDAWRAGRIERLIAHATGTDAVFDNLIGVDPETATELGPLFPVFPTSLTAASLLAPQAPQSRHNFGYLKPLLRRDFLVQHSIAYDESLRTSEDLLFYLTLLLEGARARMIHKALYLYTMGAGGGVSMHSHTRPRDDDVREALGRVLARYSEQIDAGTAGAIEQRIRFLRHIAPISEFYFARHTRDYGRMAYLLARHVSVQREAVGKVFNLLRR